MKFILDKSKWICGSPKNNLVSSNCLGHGSTCLLNTFGYMCCLGQFVQQVDSSITNDSLFSLGRPSDLEKEINYFSYIEVIKRNGLKELEIVRNTELAQEAIGINDNSHTSIEQKIYMLKELFEKHGHEIEVIN